jgi:hypothetical protein
MDFNVYAGILGRKFGERGDAACTHYGMIWADYDYGDVGHKHAELPDLDSALRAIDGLPEPSMVVSSGGGIHVYWALDGQCTLEQWRSAMAGIIQTTGGDKSTKNQERILRVPGTYNWKTGNPRPVRIIKSATNLVYSIDKFPVGVTEKQREKSASTMELVTGVSTKRELNTELDIVNQIPAEKVVSWLQIPTHKEGSQLRAKCPVHDGFTPNSLLVGGVGHESQCRCFGACDRIFSNADLVMALRGCTLMQAKDLLYAEFFRESPIVQVQKKPNWVDQLQFKRNGRIIPNEANVALILDNTHTIRHDDYKRTVTVSGNPLTSTTSTELLIQLQQSTDFPCEPTISVVERALEFVAHKNHYNSLTDRISALKWDGKPRLDRWLYYCTGLTDETVLDMGRIFVLGMVYRALKPGCQFDYTLCLTGPQGYRKTSFFREIVGPDDFVYIGEVGTKDGEAQLSGRWLVEIEEGFMLLNKPAQTKAFLTRLADTYRGAYERKTSTYPRQCVFALSSNLGYVTEDQTGARRYLPVQIDRVIDTSWVSEHRYQLFAEAVPLVNAGVLPVINNLEAHQQILISPNYAVKRLKACEEHSLSLDRVLTLLDIKDRNKPRLLAQVYEALQAAGYRQAPSGLFVRNLDNFEQHLRDFTAFHGEFNGTKAIPDQSSQPDFKQTGKWN